MTVRVRPPRRVPRAVLAVAALALAAAVTGAAGGFAKAPEKEPRAFAPGERIDQGAFAAEVVRARAGGTVRPDEFGAERIGITDHRRTVLVEMRMRNLGRTDADPLDYIGAVEHRDGRQVLIPRMKVRSGRDGLGFIGLDVRRPDRPSEFSFPPGVDTSFRTRWALPPGHGIPAEVTVELVDYELRRGKFYDLPDGRLPVMTDTPDVLASEEPRPVTAFAVDVPVGGRS